MPQHHCQSDKKMDKSGGAKVQDQASIMQVLKSTDNWLGTHVQNSFRNYKNEHKVLIKAQKHNSHAKECGSEKNTSYS